LIHARSITNTTRRVTQGEATMRIQIQDDNQNWLNWGNIVFAWIQKTQSRPNSVGELKQQLTAAAVVATVDGPDQRVVAVLDYSDAPTDPLMIVIPTAKMLAEKLKTVTSGPYPLPLFYDIAYAGAPRANLSPKESQAFAIRRVGEYTVNECC
jgi:hypothetical protein